MRRCTRRGPDRARETAPQPFREIGSREVALDRPHLDAVAGAQVFGETDQQCLSPGHEHEIHAAIRQGPRKSRAQTLGSAGNQGPGAVSIRKSSRHKLPFPQPEPRGRPYSIPSINLVFDTYFKSARSFVASLLPIEAAF